MTITDGLIDFLQVSPDFDAFEMMRLSLFDWVVCGCAGSGEEAFAGFCKAIIDAGGATEATVFGGGQVPAATAALLNGTLSHALDFDDTHFAHIGHPSVAVVPAVLALAQAEQIGFDDMLAACLIGVEASIHIGMWLGRQHYETGFHQTATAGAFGATLGAAQLLRLEPTETRHALGLCASLASGLKAQFGTGGKPLNAGLAARSGVEAATWARAGLTGADDGPEAFAATHQGESDADSLDTLGRGTWQIMRISHKFHACCHGLHAMLDALQALNAAKLGVDRLLVSTHPRWMTVCNQHNPKTGLAAKFSYRHTAAMALTGLDTGRAAHFSDRQANNPRLIETRQRVEVAADPSLTETQCRLHLTLTNGEQVTRLHDLASPISLDLRRDRLRAKAAVFLGVAGADGLWDAISGNDLAAMIRVIERSEVIL